MMGAARNKRKVPRVMICACRRMAGSATDQVAVTPEMNFPRSAHLPARRAPPVRGAPLQRSLLLWRCMKGRERGRGVGGLGIAQRGSPVGIVAVAPGREEHVGHGGDKVRDDREHRPPAALVVGLKVGRVLSAREERASLFVA